MVSDTGTFVPMLAEQLFDEREARVRVRPRTLFY
jgi:hypothetical protein